jgi:hypothetical protein
MLAAPWLIRLESGLFFFLASLRLREGFQNEAMNNGANVGYESDLWQTGIAVCTSVVAAVSKKDWHLLGETVL